MVDPFEYQKPTKLQIERITEVREKCRKLYDTLLCLESSRERSLAVTKLEEVSMWANKAIVFGPAHANLPTSDGPLSVGHSGAAPTTTGDWKAVTVST